MNKIKLKSKNFENEIEDYLIRENIMSNDGMAYSGANVHSLTVPSKELPKIIEENAIVFEDEKFFYIVMRDDVLLELQGKKLSDEQRQFATDWSIDKFKKSQYDF